MKNYKLTCVYDGSRYKGWQRLGNGEVTIQETLEKTIEVYMCCYEDRDVETYVRKQIEEFTQ